MKILLVESDPVQTAHFKSFISSQAAFEGSAVESGEEALEAHRRFRFDLALIDLQLHGSLSGIETAERLIQIHPIELAFYSQAYDPAISQAALLLQPILMLTKPLDTERLAEALRPIHQCRLRAATKALAERRSQLNA